MQIEYPLDSMFGCIYDMLEVLSSFISACSLSIRLLMQWRVILGGARGRKDISFNGGSCFQHHPMRKLHNAFEKHPFLQNIGMGVYLDFGVHLSMPLSVQPSSAENQISNCAVME